MKPKKKPTPQQELNILELLALLTNSNVVKILQPLQPCELCGTRSLVTTPSVFLSKISKDAPIVGSIPFLTHNIPLFHCQKCHKSLICEFGFN